MQPIIRKDGFENSTHSRNTEGKKISGKQRATYMTILYKGYRTGSVGIV